MYLIDFRRWRNRYLYAHCYCCGYQNERLTVTGFLWLVYYVSTSLFSTVYFPLHHVKAWALFQYDNYSYDMDTVTKRLGWSLSNATAVTTVTPPPPPKSPPVTSYNAQHDYRFSRSYRVLTHPSQQHPIITSRQSSFFERIRSQRWSTTQYQQ